MRYFSGDTHRRMKIRLPGRVDFRNAQPGECLHGPAFIDIGIHWLVRNNRYQEAVLGVPRRVSKWDVSRAMDFEDFLQYGCILTVVQVDAAIYGDRRHSTTGIRNQIPHGIDVRRAQSETRKGRIIGRAGSLTPRKRFGTDFATDDGNWKFRSVLQDRGCGNIQVGRRRGRKSHEVQERRQK